MWLIFNSSGLHVNLFFYICRGTGARILLAPLTSILYLWDEPGGERALFWQPDNYCERPEELPLNKVFMHGIQ